MIVAKPVDSQTGGKGVATNSPSRLDHELTALFGKECVTQSKLISKEVMWMDAELVAEGARQLLQQMDNPAEQRKIVQGMDTDTAIALCKWVRVGMNGAT
jgi:uncharacterized membrane protein YheB (UPF0754 family)